MATILTANHVIYERHAPEQTEATGQVDLFADYEAIKQKFGKNTIPKGVDLQDGGMTIERNRQTGGMKREQRFGQV